MDAQSLAIQRRFEPEFTLAEGQQPVSLDERMGTSTASDGYTRGAQQPTSSPYRLHATA